MDLEMDSLGWKHLGFGVIPKLWAEYQTKYLMANGSKVPGTTWMSRLIRKIWKLHKNMWIERNSHVHKSEGSCHSAEQQAVEEAIRWEFSRVLDGLPAEMSGNFKGDAERIAEDKNIVGKQ